MWFGKKSGAKPKVTGETIRAGIDAALGENLQATTVRMSTRTNRALTDHLCERLGIEVMPLLGKYQSLTIERDEGLRFGVFVLSA